MEWVILILVGILLFVFFRKKDDEVETISFEEQEEPRRQAPREYEKIYEYKEEHHKSNKEQNVILKKVSDYKPNKLEPTTKEELKINLSIDNPKNKFIKEILELKQIKGKKNIENKYWFREDCICLDIIDEKMLGCIIKTDSYNNCLIEKIFFVKIKDEKISLNLDLGSETFKLNDFISNKEYRINLFRYKNEIYEI